MSAPVLKENNEVSPEHFPYRSFKDLPIYDRRTMPRWGMACKAFYRNGKESTLFRTETRDVTVSGACLYISPDTKLNAHVHMKICLPSGKSFEPSGRVLWKNKDSHGVWYAGILFDALPLETQEILLHYSFRARY